MMKKHVAVVVFSIVALFSGSHLKAQDAIVQEGEFGIGIGASHYFGDLNTKARLNRAKIAASIFFRKNFGNYIALRVGASFAQIGYSDQYNTHNTYMYSRNLSFNSKVWELTLQGDFNFFRFLPGEAQYNFTPYVTFGAGVFSYDPYAYLKPPPKGMQMAIELYCFLSGYKALPCPSVPNWRKGIFSPRR